MADENTPVTYRKSATPGVPPSTKSQLRLEQLRVCPLGRLVMQIGEIDLEIKEIKESPKPSRMVIATLMGIKFNVLKALLPYAYATVPVESNTGGGNTHVPVIITLDTSEIMREEEDLVNKINDTLEEVRQEFPSYQSPDNTPSAIDKYRMTIGYK